MLKHQTKRQFSFLPGLKMKLLILALATLAVASAAWFPGKTVDVLDDGTIVIRNDFGKQIIISKKIGPMGQHLTEIDVSGPFTPGKKIQIDDYNLVKVSPGTGSLEMDNQDMMDRLKRSPKVSTTTTQTDAALADVMKDFQAITTQAGYDKLLNKLQKSVTKGKLDSSVLDQVQSLAETMPWYTPSTTSGTSAPAVVNQEPKTQLPWWLCNDISCFKQMRMLNGIYQKAPPSIYDQYLKTRYPMYDSQYPVMGTRVYPGYVGYPARETPYGSDPLARKTFWSDYMNRINMSPFVPQYDEPQQQIPVSSDVTPNQVYYY